MRKLKRLPFLLFLTASIFFLSCQDDPCDKTKIDKIEVGFWCWGKVTILDKTGLDVTSNYMDTPFKVEFLKMHCDGHPSDTYEYNYHLLEDGTMKKEGAGYWSFDMTNELDKIDCTILLMRSDGFSPTTNIKGMTVSQNDWSSGEVRVELDMRFAEAGEYNDVDWHHGTINITINPPIAN